MPFQTNYTPTDWYWVVAGSTSVVWASARTAYVPVTDATYVAWLAAGNVATQIASAADLVGVMLDQWVTPMLGPGVQVTSTSTPALDGTYALSATALVTLAGLSTGITAGKPLPGGGTTFSYADAANQPHAFTGSEFLNFASAIEDYVYNLTEAITLLVLGQSATMPTTPLVIA